MIQEFIVPSFDRADILRKHGRKYARLFMVVLARLKKSADLRYVLALIRDTLEDGLFARLTNTSLTILQCLARGSTFLSCMLRSR